MGGGGAGRFPATGVFGSEGSGAEEVEEVGSYLWVALEGVGVVGGGGAAAAGSTARRWWRFGEGMGARRGRRATVEGGDAISELS